MQQSFAPNGWHSPAGTSPPSGSCVRLVGSHLQLREGNVEFCNLARFPTYWRTEHLPRSATSYVHQACLMLFALPVAVAGDLALIGAWAWVRAGAPTCR